MNEYDRTRPGVRAGRTRAFKSGVLTLCGVARRSGLWLFSCFVCAFFHILECVLGSSLCVSVTSDATTDVIREL